MGKPGVLLRLILARSNGVSDDRIIHWGGHDFPYHMPTSSCMSTSRISWFILSRPAGRPPRQEGQVGDGPTPYRGWLGGGRPPCRAQDIPGGARAMGRKLYRKHDDPIENGGNMIGHTIRSQPTMNDRPWIIAIDGSHHINRSDHRRVEICMLTSPSTPLTVLPIPVLPV